MLQDLMRNYKQKLCLPVDVVVAKSKDHSQARVYKPEQVSKDEAILDIGPQQLYFFKDC